MITMYDKPHEWAGSECFDLLMLRVIGKNGKETYHRGSSTMRFLHSSPSEAAHTSNNSSIATRTLTL
jgi:hypothetical protein